MANNIIPLDPNNFSSEVYSPTDESLITSNLESNQFDLNTDYVEYFVFDLNNNQISPLGNDASFSDYLLLDNEIYIDPIVDLFNIGIDTGIVNTLYNFYRKWLSSSPQSTYYIKEISSNRKEVRLTTARLDKDELKEEVENFFPLDISSDYYPDFSLNFGDGNIYIATNMLFDDTNNQHSVLVKLYKPLPSFIQPNGGSNPWIVTQQRDSVGYNVEFEQVILPFKTIQLS